MTPLALVLLALQPAPGAAAETDREMLQAFRSACGRVDDFDAIRADALASDWEEIEPSADPRVARLNGIGHELAAEEGGEVRAANFRRRLGDRLLFLIASRASRPGGLWRNGCRVYHFEAGEAIAPATLEAWMGRPPTGFDELPGAAVRRRWEPAWRDGITIDVMYLRSGSEASERYGTGGNVLLASFIGGN